MRELPFHAHVKELRRRLFWSCAALGIGGAIGFIWREPVVNWLQKPLHLPLYYNSPSGSFMFMMKVSFLIGLVVALPMIVYHLVRFIEPAFEAKVSTRRVMVIMAVSLGLTAAGCIFAYYVIAPMALHFFAGFTTPGIHPLIAANDYFNFMLGCLITFAIIFQLPLLLLFFDFISPLPPAKLLHYERHVIVGSLVVAVLLPFTYDPLTQLVMAVPIILLYNISIVLIVMVHRRRARRRARGTVPAPRQQSRPHPSAPMPAHSAHSARAAARPATGQPRTAHYPNPYVIDLSRFSAKE